MTVITGPLDCFTTFRLGESLGTSASFAAWAARASGVIVFPVMTIAAPMTALRMRNERRLMLDGIVDSAGSPLESVSRPAAGVLFIRAFGLIVLFEIVSGKERVFISQSAFSESAG